MKALVHLVCFLLLPLCLRATEGDPNTCTCDYTEAAYNSCRTPADGSPGDGDGCGEGLIDAGDQFQSKSDCVKFYQNNKECNQSTVSFSRSETNQVLRDNCNFRLCMSESKVAPECLQDGIGCKKWLKKARKTCTQQMKTHGCVIGANKKWQAPSRPANQKKPARR